MAEGPEGAPVVQVQTVMRGTMVQEVYAPASIEAGNLQELKAPIASPAVTVLVKVGQQVAEGDVLVELDATELQEDVKAQELALLRAQNSLERLRREQENAPLQLERQLEEARKQLIEAQNNLARLRRGSDDYQAKVAAAQAAIAKLQEESASSQRAVDEARQALLAAESAYMANPGSSAATDAYRKAEEAYKEAVQQNQQAAHNTADQLRKAQDELAALLEEGQRQASGESTDVRMAEIQVSLAEVAVREAEEALARGADREQIQVAEAEVDAARATLEKLRKNLNSTRITAPAAGTVLSVAVKTGDPVQQGAVLVRTGDMEKMKLVGRVEAVDLDSLEPGQTIMVTSALLPLANFEGTVTEIGQQSSNSSDPYMGGGWMGENVTFEVWGEVLNPDGRLKSGMSAEMRIETARRENVLTVPLLAVREDGGQASVLVVNNYTVEVRPIQTGLVTNREVEVLGGLEEGEQIVVSPFGLIETLNEGDAVRIEVSPGMMPDGFMRGPMGVPSKAMSVPLGLVTGGR